MNDVVQHGLPLALFVIFCTLSVVSAIGVVALRNPVSSAFALILAFLNVACIFAMEEAYFIAAVQVIVSAASAISDVSRSFSTRRRRTSATRADTSK